MDKQEYSETHTVISPDGNTVTTVTVSMSSSDTVTGSNGVTTSSSVTVTNTVTTNGKVAGNDITE